MSRIPDGFFQQEAVDLARALIGARLLVNGVGGTIVETEAYDAADPGSHSFGGRTKRNGSMFDTVGRAYVYRIYGLHWCMNIVGGSAPGAAVLVRALEPTHGLDVMHVRRRITKVLRLCSGPGNVCQALAITGDYDGAPLDAPPFQLLLTGAKPPLICGSRIGVTKAASTLWRFGWRGSAFLSKPFSG